MDFVEDLNYDDEDLTNFPIVDPGQAFQKGWRIRNSGTCIWNSTYFIRFIRGDQMSGQPAAILGGVDPGQTYDMYVDLVAPAAIGKHVGYWQMHNTENQAFGQTVWVAVEIRDSEAPTATPTPTEAPTPEPTATEIPPEPTATEEPGADLRDKNWILEGYLASPEDEQLTNPILEIDVALIFWEEGELEGFSGCNSFSGRYVTDGRAIALRDISVTNISCDTPEGIMEQEAAFLALIERAEAYRINGEGKLEITREVIENDQPIDKVILLFGE
jgi:heat shock protein HslJ